MVKLKNLEFIEELESDESLICVLDEAGFGTKPLRRYGYSKKGTPAIIRFPKVDKNLTCTATISVHGVEFIHFFSGGS